MDTSFVNREMTLAAAETSSVARSSSMTEEEFRAFYERTSRPVWAYLARVTGNRQAADDLLQEAYYRFYRAGAQHESEAHRRNSLFQIATNVARDAHRRRDPLQHRSEIEMHELVSGASSVAEQIALSTDLGRAMAQLNSQQREMLWLAYALGSSHEEIAELVGVTTGSVKSLLLRARRKLAALLNSNNAAEMTR
jgi:RNA polymerase sigma-70 factor (ECF subfamily)